MSSSSFRREYSGLGSVRAAKADDSQIRPAIGRSSGNPHQDLAAAALSGLADVKVPDTYELTFETPRGTITFSVDPNGGPLDRLGHGCFRAGLEAGLARYLEWLRAIAEGHPFPADHQLPGSR